MLAVDASYSVITFKMMKEEQLTFMAMKAGGKQPVDRSSIIGIKKFVASNSDLKSSRYKKKYLSKRCEAVCKISTQIHSGE